MHRLVPSDAVDIEPFYIHFMVVKREIVWRRFDDVIVHHALRETGVKVARYIAKAAWSLDQACQKESRVEDRGACRHEGFIPGSVGRAERKIFHGSVQLRESLV